MRHIFKLCFRPTHVAVNKFNICRVWNGKSTCKVQSAVPRFWKISSGATSDPMNQCTKVPQLRKAKMIILIRRSNKRAPSITGGTVCVQNFKESHECGSPELSHFATFFLEQQAKVSIVKSCVFVIKITVEFAYPSVPLPICPKAESTINGEQPVRVDRVPWVLSLLFEIFSLISF